MKVIILSVVCLLAIRACLSSQENVIQDLTAWKNLAKPDTVGNWLLPARNVEAMPVWGHLNGISVGLSPLPGPRGLLRIYTPYLDIHFPQMINYIAFEPVPEGETKRGFSELEYSQLDNVKGKRFWSSGDSVNKGPGNPFYPARGSIQSINSQNVLVVYIFSESFNNGAEVFVRLRFFENKPFEVELTTYKTARSAPLENLILTATMGNFARLRRLYLKNETKLSLDIWPEYASTGFTGHFVSNIDDLITDRDGRAIYIATPDEMEPGAVQYAPGTKEHWKYKGKIATQYWISPHPKPQLQGLVNGRFVYWASDRPIPGGISFENFELKEPFENGTTFIFGIEPTDPYILINEITNNGSKP